MLLERTQRDVLYRHISEQIGPQPLLTIGAWLGQSVRNRLTIEPNIDAQIGTLLNLFELEGLAPDEPLILKLLRLPNFKTYPELKALLAQLEAHKAQQDRVDPFRQYLLHNGPFLDRERFRAVLRRFVSKDNKTRVLVVNGPSQIGKSYSKWYIKHLNEAFSGFIPFYFPAENGLADTYPPDDVARSIVSLVDKECSGMPEQQEQERRWAQKLCFWVISRLNEQRPFWLVLDGFRGASPGTQSLIHQLVSQISQALNGVDGRLILFDYDPKLLEPLECAFEVEEVRPVERSHLMEFFDKVLPHVEGQPPEERAAIVQLAVDKVLERVTVTPADPSWQRQIRKAVQEVMELLLQVPEPQSASEPVQEAANAAH
jgi:hypothetical protein